MMVPCLANSSTVAYNIPVTRNPYWADNKLTNHLVERSATVCYCTGVGACRVDRFNSRLSVTIYI